MIPQSGTILCVELDDAERDSRCEVLTNAGYTAVSASPPKAVSILSQRAFDLIVTYGLGDHELEQISRVADGAELLTLSSYTLPTVLLFLVDERLRQLRATHREQATMTDQRTNKPDHHS
jgi:CheY-like chemotaxis protein